MTDRAGRWTDNVTPAVVTALVSTRLEVLAADLVVLAGFAEAVLRGDTPDVEDGAVRIALAVSLARVFDQLDVAIPLAAQAEATS